MMRGTTRIRLPAACAAAVLCGCAGDPAQCDPRGAGFAAAAAGVLGGCYEQRVGERREALASTQDLTRRLEAEGQGIEQERSQTARQKSDTQARLSELSSDTASLRRQMGSLRETTAGQAMRKRELEQQLGSIERDLATARASRGDSPELRREVDRLTRQRDALSDDLAAALRQD